MKLRRRTAATSTTPAPPVVAPVAGCPELRACTVEPDPDPEPLGSDGCLDCAALGEQTWTHLRMCLTCGGVRCCDSSPHQHATAHFHASEHPVMRSFEPGETWRWCYVHALLG
jgi:uncharacterized UBP type Zn finger protein